MEEGETTWALAPDLAGMESKERRNFSEAALPLEVGKAELRQYGRVWRDGNTGSEHYRRPGLGSLHPHWAVHSCSQLTSRAPIPVLGLLGDMHTCTHTNMHSLTHSRTYVRTHTPPPKPSTTFTSFQEYVFYVAK